MNPKSRFHLMIIILILASLACGISDITGPTSATEVPGALDTAVAKSLAETASMQTAIAQGVANQGNPTQGSGSVGAPTIQVQAPTNTLTPSITVSPTSDGAKVSVSQATNCRSGPGTVYDWLGALNPGQEVDILGKDPSGSSFYIKNPTNPSGFCWIWNTYATVSGNVAAVPVFTPMPTPTPAKTSTPTSAPIDFAVSFSEITTCFGFYYVELKVTNTGSLTWQSFESSIKDNVTATTVVHSDDVFQHWNGCNLALSQDDLTPGETGTTDSNLFNYNPAGNSMTATLKLCSVDGQAGTCLTKTITFTP
ncbi:hypothetical protein ACFLXB_01535 [Chloroflexota bacterium]